MDHFTHAENENAPPFKGANDVTSREVTVTPFRVTSSEVKVDSSGIRIKAMSDIPKRIVVSLSTTRGKKTEHKIDVLEASEKAMYDPAKFAKVLPAMAKQIEAGKMTHEQIINKCEVTGALTEEQKTQVRNIGKAAGIDAEINEDEDFFGDNK